MEEGCLASVASKKHLVGRCMIQAADEMDLLWFKPAGRALLVFSALLVPSSNYYIMLELEHRDHLSLPKNKWEKTDVCICTVMPKVCRTV